jgi:hypothetical protein
VSEARKLRRSSKTPRQALFSAHMLLYKWGKERLARMEAETRAQDDQEAGKPDLEREDQKAHDAAPCCRE